MAESAEICMLIITTMLQGISFEYFKMTQETRPQLGTVREQAEEALIDSALKHNTAIH